jgi:hypothetical protein
VPPGRETWTHYFSFLGGLSAVSIKSPPGHVTENLYFCICWDLWVTLLLSNASGAQDVNTLFFMLRWDRYGFHKKCAGTCYAKLVFFHPVVFAGHVVHSSVSGA